MSSKQTDPVHVPLAQGMAADTPAMALAAARELPPWSLKRLVPRGLFGRSIIIIVTPLILVQAIAAWVFYDRHWDTVARRLGAAVGGEIALVIEAIPAAKSTDNVTGLFYTAFSTTDLVFALRPDERLPDPLPPSPRTGIAGPLTGALAERLSARFIVEALGDPRTILVSIQLSDSILAIAVPRARLYTSTTYIFVLWMIGSSLVLFAIATMFMRNQIRALRRLASAADAFGRGQSVDGFKLEGSIEIRQAGIAFLAMRDRIQRQITQRTEMLAGVSHDLRTPLTRMRLAIALLGDGHAFDELKSDVAEMEHMVEGYLDFARGEGTEAPVETDLPLLLEEVVANARRDGSEIALVAPEELVVSLRPNAMRRCLANLVGNARRHGKHVWLTAMERPGGIDIFVDDDGPGIPPEKREAVFRPFLRLDPSRNQSTGGVGLGLTIARDVARSHGGDITLETSPQGGLRAHVHLPT